MSYTELNKGPLWEKTGKFALRVIQLYARLPETCAAQVIGGQVLRSGTSPGAQWLADCRNLKKLRIGSNVDRRRDRPPGLD